MVVDSSKSMCKASSLSNQALLNKLKCNNNSRFSSHNPHPGTLMEMPLLKLPIKPMLQVAMQEPSQTPPAPKATKSQRA